MMVMDPAVGFCFFFLCRAATIRSYKSRLYPFGEKGTVMRKVKLIAIVALLIFTVVIFLQNTEPMEARILLLKVQMSRVLMLMLTFVLGLVMGILIATGVLRKKRKT